MKRINFFLVAIALVSFVALNSCKMKSPADMIEEAVEEVVEEVEAAVDSVAAVVDSAAAEMEEVEEPAH